MATNEAVARRADKAAPRRGIPSSAAEQRAQGIWAIDEFLRGEAPDPPPLTDAQRMRITAALR